MLWFWLWSMFVLFLLVLPLGYGWGYRGWGPPYPSYYRRRRSMAAAGAPADRAVDPAVDPAVHEASAWGALDDVLWVIAVIALLWLLIGLLV